MFTYKLLGCNRPLLKDLYEFVVPSVADRWRDIGVQLLHPTLVDDRTLDVIAADHQNSVKECCRNMFEKWLETQIDASWKQLLEAISNIKLQLLADKLKKILQGKKYMKVFFIMDNE